METLRIAHFQCTETLVGPGQNKDDRYCRRITRKRYTPGGDITHKQTGARIPKRSGILDPQVAGSCILDIIFSFAHRMLEVLDPVRATLLLDHRDLGSQTEKI